MYNIYNIYLQFLTWKTISGILGVSRYPCFVDKNTYFRILLIEAPAASSQLQGDSRYLNCFVILYK